MRYVFAYGSLLNPGSLAATLPQLTPERCLPATCAGLRRVYEVAFPNDGSQDDKAYTDAAGVRPPVVLFWDVVADAEASVAGVCVPVTDAELAALRRRELRYDLREVAAVGAAGFGCGRRRSWANRGSPGRTRWRAGWCRRPMSGPCRRASGSGTRASPASPTPSRPARRRPTRRASGS